ncbi:hypothetical protein [Microbulbifer sp. MCCC 1A16149]|uniref:hypothetical protein n=1 Tax=Microbulbifer sp. MCCC 1A16149 TaxID=3411322 RepID=UPI003D13C252
MSEYPTGLEDWTEERARASGFGRALKPDDGPVFQPTQREGRRFLSTKPQMKYSHYKGTICGPYCAISPAWLRGLLDDPRVRGQDGLPQRAVKAVKQVEVVPGTPIGHNHD